MTTVQTVKKEVNQLKRQFLPKKDLTIMFSFGPTDEPHGKYGYKICNVHTGEVKPLPEDEEVLLLKRSFKTLPKHCSHPDHMWSTFEKYLKSHECKCKLHKKVES